MPPLQSSPFNSLTAYKNNSTINNTISSPLETTNNNPNTFKKRVPILFSKLKNATSITGPSQPLTSAYSSSLGGNLESIYKHQEELKKINIEENHWIPREKNMINTIEINEDTEQIGNSGGSSDGLFFSEFDIGKQITKLFPTSTSTSNPSLSSEPAINTINSTSITTPSIYENFSQPPPLYSQQAGLKGVDYQKAYPIKINQYPTNDTISESFSFNPLNTTTIASIRNGIQSHSLEYKIDKLLSIIEKSQIEKKEKKNVENFLFYTMFGVGVIYLLDQCSK